MTNAPKKKLIEVSLPLEAINAEAGREKNIRHGGISRSGQTIEIRARDAQTLDAARALIQDQFADLDLKETVAGSDHSLSATLAGDAPRIALWVLGLLWLGVAITRKEKS